MVAVFYCYGRVRSVQWFKGEIWVFAAPSDPTQLHPVTVLRKVYLWKGLTDSRTVFFFRCHHSIKFIFYQHRYPPVPTEARGTCRVRGCRRHPTLDNSTTAGSIAFKFGGYLAGIWGRNHFYDFDAEAEAMTMTSSRIRSRDQLWKIARSRGRSRSQLLKMTRSRSRKKRNGGAPEGPPILNRQLRACLILDTHRGAFCEWIRRTSQNSRRCKEQPPRRRRSVALPAPSGRRQRLDEADVEYKLPKLSEAEAEAEASKVKKWLHEAKLEVEAGFVPYPGV